MMGTIDNTTVGKLLLTFLLAIAEFERNTIRERMESGKAIARLDPNYREGPKHKLDHWPRIRGDDPDQAPCRHPMP
jgi:DNA invertase Pin-like site-specific DNA recombinase